jgi:fibronectin type 3 domain-containing protein
MRVQNILLALAVLIIALTSCNGGSDINPASPTYPSGKPFGLTFTVGSHSATISWNSVPGATGYYVYISEDGVNFPRYQSGLIVTTSFQVFDLVNDKTYYFGVSAVGSNGWESSIAYIGGAPTAVPVVPQFSGTGPDPNAGPPEPPENLQGTPKDAYAEFFWDPSPSGDVIGYRIYRIFTGVGWTVIRDNYTDLSFTDTDLTNEVAYSYVVTAIDSEGLESVDSNKITLTPKDFIPEIVTGLLNVLNPGRIILEWDRGPEADIVKFSIERVEGSEPITGGELIVRFLLNMPTSSDPANPNYVVPGLIGAYMDVTRDKIILVDSAIEVGKSYIYRIAAVDATGHEGPAASTTTGAVF